MASKTDRLCDDLDANELPTDATLEALVDSRCRTVLETLVREDAPTELRELTPRLSPDVDGSSDRVASRLHHVVLPKLDDVGLVTYDWSENVVDLEPPDQRVEGLLDCTALVDRQ